MQHEVQLGPGDLLKVIGVSCSIDLSSGGQRYPDRKGGLMEKDVLNASDLAGLLGVTTGRVYQLIADGVIPSTRIGRSIRIPRPAWEAWLRQQTDRALGCDAHTKSELEEGDTRK